MIIGSSPRLWGTANDPGLLSVDYLRRFIPTPVGNGKLSKCRLTAESVHPHACGERMPVSTPLLK